MSDNFIPGYVVIKKIGSGAFGDTWLATKNGDINPNTNYVIKKIPKDKMKMAEVHAGELLDHPNVMKFYEYFEDEKFSYLTLEYIDGVDLFSFMELRNLEPLPEHLARKIFCQLASAVEYCHKKGVSHRDLKLENVLINRTTHHVTLIDFGLCKTNTEDTASCTDVVGSVDYIPPEVLEERPYSPQRSDVWSLGVILYCILFGNFPFCSEERIDALVPNEGEEKKEHPPLTFPTSVTVSRDARDLCRKMMSIDPAKRISMTEVLKHKWMLVPEHNTATKKPIQEESSTDGTFVDKLNNNESRTTNSCVGKESKTLQQLMEEICLNFGAGKSANTTTRHFSSPNTSCSSCVHGPCQCQSTAPIHAM